MPIGRFFFLLQETRLASLGESWLYLRQKVDERAMRADIRVIASGTVIIGTLRGSPHLCKPIRRLVLRTVVAHPFPAGRCLRLPGHACVRHARQASASSEGSFVSLRWYCRASHSHVRCFCAAVSGPPEGKEAGLFPGSAYGRRLKARVVPFGRTLLVPLPICSPRPAGADQAV